MSSLKKGSNKYVLYGRVSYCTSNRPAEKVRVVAMDADLFFDDKLGEAITNDDGQFKIEYDTSKFRDLFERDPDIYLLIYDSKGKLLTSTRDSVIRNIKQKVHEINVLLPGSGPGAHEPESVELVGGIPVDRKAFGKIDSKAILDIAEKALQAKKPDPETIKILDTLSPKLHPDNLKRQFSGTPLVIFLWNAAHKRQMRREDLLKLEEIFFRYSPYAGYATYDTTNFTFTYQTSGSDQPPADDTGGNITMPGTGAIVGTTTGGNGVPDYVEKVGFWLENALATYTNAPFNLQNPATGGKIPVDIAYTSFSGFTSPTGSMTVSNDLNDDLLAAVPTHELMHLIQYLYEAAGTSGIWYGGMLEGGAVLGEDVVFDTHNRYIVQATGGGILGSPNTSLTGWSYHLALFLKYISEQQSSNVHPGDEPTIGVETYKALLEKFNTDGHTTAALESAIHQLPWYQKFYKFSYLDAAKLDETNSETLLGNFWLACYLKDFGVGVPDRRFDFMEDEEDATWDTIFLGSDTVSTLGSVSLTSTNTLNTGGSLTLNSGAGGSVSAFAARFYKVNVDSAVDTLRVDFTATAGFTRPIIQIVLVEAGNVVRDIIRSDKTTFSKTIANAGSSTNLDHICIVVAGTDTGGSYSLAVQDTAASPDVMVTRWHHTAGTHYEIDSYGWAWTWVSPDIWVDNDSNGLADSEVYFNQNNQLFIRLRNQGHADASGIEVQFWYQDASGGLHDGSWMQVTNTSGVIQTLSGLNLAAGATDMWSVDWAPAPSGGSHHFCVRAAVTVPGDPNTDNKRVLSNFGNVIAAGPYFDLPLLRRIPWVYEELNIDVIPRTYKKWFVSAVDRILASRKLVRRGEEVVDIFRIRHRSDLITQKQGTIKADPQFALKTRYASIAGASRIEARPDPFGHYPTDPRALPPGLENVPLITVAHIVDGKPEGGFTFAIREKKQ